MEIYGTLSEKNYCNDRTIRPLHNIIQCIICKAVFPKEGEYEQDLIMHLYTSHKITELTETRIFSEEIYYKRRKF